MDIDPSLLSKADNCKLLTNLVVPRPIAWVSTVKELLAAMNISAADFPPDQSELPAAGLLATPSLRIKPLVYCRTTDRIELARVTCDPSQRQS